MFPDNFQCSFKSRKEGLTAFFPFYGRSNRFFDSALPVFSFQTSRKKMQKRNIDDDEIILVEDETDRFFLTQDHNGRKSIIKGGWVADSDTQYMLIKQYFLQQNGKSRDMQLVISYNFYDKNSEINIKFYFRSVEKN